MRYAIGTPEYDAYRDGYQQAVDHEMRNGKPPQMPKGYTPSQRSAWEIGKDDGYQDT